MDELESLVEQLRAALLKRERAVSTRLLRAYGEAYRRLQPQIDALEADIAAMDKPTAAKVRRLRRFRDFEAQISDELSRFGNYADVELGQAARDAIGDGGADAAALIVASVPAAVRPAVTAALRQVPPDAVETLLQFLAPGSPMHAALVRDLGPTVAKSVSDALVSGLASGYNPRKVASIIRQTLGQALSWALRTARTAMLWAYRESSRAMYAVNPDIVKGWIWHAELGPRTCMACIAQHGSVHPISETLNDHHNGRCAMVPVTLERPPIQSGRDWFATLTDAQQQAMFNNRAMYRAWKDGAIGWDDLISYHDDAVYGKMLQLPSLKQLLGDGAGEYYNWWRK